MAGVEMSYKVFLIGLDALSPSLVEKWVEEGKLPTFATLMREGVWGRLESVPNMNSAAAWPAAFTGKNPGKHGCYWFTTPLPNSYEFRYTNATDLKAKPVWQLLNERGKRVGVINVPMTYPAQEVNGFWVAGLEAPGIESENYAYPKNLLATLINYCKYIHYSRAMELVANGKPCEALTRLQEMVAMRLCANKYLKQTYEPDFLMTVFSESDQVAHGFWKYFDPSHPLYEPGNKYQDAILDIYQRLDGAVSELMANLSDDTVVMLMSDHGVGINTYGGIYLNDWLGSQGFLKYQKKSPFSVRKLALRTMEKGYMYIVKSDIGTIRTIKKLIPNKLIHSARSAAESRLFYANINWEKTQAFSDGVNDSIWVNLAGRQPKGIVQPGAEYEAVREQIIAGLYECRDMITGEKVVDRAAKREELYHGDYVDRAPDIEIKWKEDRVIYSLVEGTRPAFERSTSLINSLSGNHQSLGVFFAWGKPIRSSFRVTGMHIMDIAPTVLYAMGEAIPEDMDGEAQVQIFREEFVRTNPLRIYRTIAAAGQQEELDYSEEEQAEIKKRLEDLGYI
jgi:predicted AlkP superfamily phosphohydrolase/phosphomutase